MFDLLVPATCALCHIQGSGLCPSCASGLPRAPSVHPPPGLDDLWALLSYEGQTTRLVAELKYRNHRDAVNRLGRALSVFVQHSSTPVEHLTWAPTSPARRRRRGYDQAHQLAIAIGQCCDLPACRLLRRRRGPPQTGSDRAHRLLGPSFEPIRRLTGHVLVVDDVCTTGATLGAAATALRHAGAQRVSGLVLATTP